MRNDRSNHAEHYSMSTLSVMHLKYSTFNVAVDKNIESMNGMHAQQCGPK